MKIKTIEAIPLAAELDTPVKMPNQVVRWFYTTLVRVTTDDGITGIGECTVRMSPRTTQSIVEDLLAPVLIGEDPLDIEGLWQKMFRTMRGRGHSRGFFVEALSGVDMALWDILGRRYQLPVGKLMGGAGRKEIPVYASSVMLDTTEAMVDKAVCLVEEGFRAIKIKVGLGPERDKENIQQIRQAVGKDIQLMADANSAYCAADAVVAGRAFEELSVLWLEEPVPPDDLAGYRRLRDKLDIRLAAGESEFTAYGIRELLLEDCIDVVQPDVSRAGGYTECRRIAHLADIFGKKFAPHTGFSSSVCVFGSLQLASWATNFDCYEYMILDNPLQHILDQELPRPKDGMVSVPQGPGLGAGLDMAAVEKYRV